MNGSHVARTHALTLLLSVASVLALPIPSTAQPSDPADDLRSVVEGTWVLIEWHVDGRVLRPPEMDGRWMVHDGMVMATRHRDGVDGYESTAGYGRYQWGQNTWRYGYDRSEDRRGDTVGTAVLQVREVPQRTFHITHEGDHLILEDDARTLRWDYDLGEDTFLLMGPERRPIRRYRRLDQALPKTP